ncbi:MAG: hypothetical protein ABSE86_19245 [Bryobacteraceae bacterium]|jgi:hypothetical protein
MTDANGGFVQIKASKFPVLPGEKEELVNDGTFGKALALYLQAKLVDLDYDAPFICCEDWGWWVELKGAPFAGVCIYSQAGDSPVDFVCTAGVFGSRKWSWKELRFVDTSAWVEKLDRDLVAVFQADPDVEVGGTFEEFPL